MILPLAALSLWGCVSEDRSDCYDNTELRFVYSVSDAEFPDKIKKVDVVLFDGEGKFHSFVQCDENALKESRSVVLTLDPGTYYVVAWANVSEHSAYGDLTPRASAFEDCKLEIPQNANDTGDPIYYAPYTRRPGTGANDLAPYAIEVRFGRKNVKILDFGRAHRTINVWVEGHIETRAEGIAPTVEISNLWSAYDFFFNTRADRRTFSQQSQEKTVDGKLYTVATFHTALGEIDGRTDVTVRLTSAGTVWHTANLKRFVEENNITDTDEIDMLCSVGLDNGVSVTVPDWSDENVNPGID